MARTKTVILGAAGRDFHNFNVLFRKSKQHEVVAFTATQIPNIDGRRYPRALAGDLYPKGIPIVPEQELESLIRDQGVQEVVFSYSDVSNQYVMSKAAVTNAAGAHFRLLGAGPTQTRMRSTVARSNRMPRSARTCGSAPRSIRGRASHNGRGRRARCCPRPA